MIFKIMLVVFGFIHDNLSLFFSISAVLKHSSTPINSLGTRKTFRVKKAVLFRRTAVTTGMYNIQSHSI